MDSSTYANFLFLPSSSTRGAFRTYFIGRRTIINNCADIIRRKGTTLVIFGERGVGKTSLGDQIVNELHNINLRNKKIKSEEPRYISVWLECEKDMVDIYEVIYHIIKPQSTKSSQSLFEQFPDVYTDNTFLDFFKGKYKIDITDLTHSFYNEIDPAFNRKLLLEMLKDITGAISKRHDVSLIFFLDELDRFENKEKLGSLVKNLNEIRFVLVGIGKDVNDLLNDHESVSRKIHAEELGRFEEQEIKQIFERAQRVSKNNGLLQIELKFDDEFLQKVVESSDGFPWMAQLIGYHSIANYKESYQKDDIVRIGLSEFEKSIKVIVKQEKILQGLSATDLIVDSLTKKEIFKVLCLTNEWLSSEEIKNSVEDKSVTSNIHDTIYNLLEERILIKNSASKYKFADPRIKLLIALAIKYNQY